MNRPQGHPMISETPEKIALDKPVRKDIISGFILLNSENALNKLLA
jgi:hypothetical protein